VLQRWCVLLTAAGHRITFGSVCSGIEAASVAWHYFGWRAAWLAEIEKYPAQLLHHHYGSGRPHYMLDPDEPGLDADERDERSAAIKAVRHLPLIPANSTTAPPNLGDMTKIEAMVRAGQVAAPDVLCGGTPCQAFSIAGLRDSLGDSRGQLTLSFARLADAIDAARSVQRKPRAVIVWENVPGVLSTKDNAFGNFLGALAGEDSPLVAPGHGWSNAGCVFGPKRAVAWRVFDAQYFGVAQRRRRVFVVASARDGFDPAAVLFEFDGLRRDTAPRREAWEEVAGTISSRTTGGGGLGTDFECAGGLQAWPAEIAPTLNAAFGSKLGLENQHIRGGRDYSSLQLARCLTTKIRIDAETETLIPTFGGGFVEAPIAFDSRQNCVSSTEVFGALGSSSPQAQAVAFSCKDHGADASVELAPTMRAMGHSGSHANAGGQLAVCVTPIDMRQASRGATMTNNRAEGSSGGAPGTGIGEPGDPAPTISTSHVPAVCVTGEITHILKAEGFDASEDGTGRGQPIVPTVNVCPTLRAGGNQTGGDRPPGTDVDTADSPLTNGMAVRRLTPRECERLQGFPDDYTLIPKRKVTAERAEKLRANGDPVQVINGELWEMAADGPRYKALGNSWAVPNVRWIGSRIDTQLRSAANASSAVTTL
jgi:DNA (cytosine-5)-methyltransferase 1